MVNDGIGIVIIKAAYAERPRTLLFFGVLRRWTNLSALRLRTPRTEAIIVTGLLTLLMHRHIWLESEARTTCSGWDLENDGLE